MAISRTNLSNKRFSWAKKIVYVGMPNAATGLKGRAGAEKFYNEALRIDPKRRGALEYSGELYLQTGDLAKAEQRLSALDKACRFGCAEYSDLKKAIAQYKASGSATSSGY